MVETISHRIQLGIYDIGLSLVNDVTHEEVLYISLNKSPVVWTETKRSRPRPLPYEINAHLEDLYQSYLEKRESNIDNKSLTETKYQTNEYPVRFIHEYKIVIYLFFIHLVLI